GSLPAARAAAIALGRVLAVSSVSLTRCRASCSARSASRIAAGTSAPTARVSRSRVRARVSLVFVTSIIGCSFLVGSGSDRAVGGAHHSVGEHVLQCEGEHDGPVVVVEGVAHERDYPVGVADGGSEVGEQLRGLGLGGGWWCLGCHAAPRSSLGRRGGRSFRMSGEASPRSTSSCAARRGDIFFGSAWSSTYLGQKSARLARFLLCVGQLGPCC